MPQPALIFDFGNVVAHFDYTRSCDRLGRRIGLTGKELLARATSAGFSEILKRYESGQMPAEEFSRQVCRLVGLDDLPHHEFAREWADIFWLNEPVAELVEQLDEAGYTLVLGSNTNDLHAGHFQKQFAGVLEHFDRLVLSFEVGHIKPAREFFLACAQAAGEAPENCVFIDDLAENVEGARAAGLQGVVYEARNHEALVSDLRARGVSLERPEGAKTR